MLNRQKISTIKDKGLRKRLEEILSQVTQAMRMVNFTGEFYIAGEIVYDSIMNNNNHEDVDVFVYNENAFKEVKKKFEGYAYQELNNPKRDIHGNPPPDVYENGTHITVGNALQKKCLPWPHIHQSPAGAPEDVFKTFDFVNSMVAITSTGELVKHKDFSSRIRVNLDGMNNFTFSRYFRYITLKGANDPDEAELRKIIDWVIDNPFKRLGYTGVPYVVEAINSLAAAMYKQPILRRHLQYGQPILRRHSQYVHDRIVKRYSDEDRIPIFQRLVLYGDFNVGKLCTEFALVKLITLRECIDGATLRDDWKETYDEVMNKYPEYFI